MQVRGVAKLLSLAVFAATVASTKVAHAQPASFFSADDDQPLPTVAISIDPLQLRFPVIQLTAEFCVARKLGLAVIVAGGEVTDDNVTSRVYGVGASGRYYLYGSFRHGFQIGAELLYASVSTENTAVTASGEGLGISTFGGYKWTHRSGFTLEVELGVTYRATGEYKDHSSFSSLLNLNVGWSI